MASQKPPRFYDDDMLCALEDALRQVWQVLKAHDPYPDWESDQDKKDLGCEVDGLSRFWDTRPSRAEKQNPKDLAARTRPLRPEFTLESGTHNSLIKE